MQQADAYAVILDICGGVKGLADELKKTPEAIYLWKGRVPEKELDGVLRAVRRLARRKMTALRRQTKKIPTKADLRPDLYPKARGAGRARKPPGGKRGTKEKTEAQSGKAGEAKA